MKLGEKQEHFSVDLAKLIRYITEDMGKGLRLRELTRTRQQARWFYKAGKGILNSNHCHSLACDMYITDDGEVLWSGDAYVKAGAFWKSLDDIALPEIEHCWGGLFKRRDVYHFSFKHNGVA